MTVYNLSHSQTLPITVGQILSTVYCIFNSILNWKCDHSVYYMTSMRLVKGMLHNVQFDQKQAVILCKDPSGKIVKDLMRSLLGSSDKSLQEVHIHVLSFHTVMDQHLRLMDCMFRTNCHLQLTDHTFHMDLHSCLHCECRVCNRAIER